MTWALKVRCSSLAAAAMALWSGGGNLNGYAVRLALPGFVMARV